jgi:hypothetical protein
MKNILFVIGILCLGVCLGQTPQQAAKPRVVGAVIGVVDGCKIVAFRDLERQESYNTQGNVKYFVRCPDGAVETVSPQVVKSDHGKVKKVVSESIPTLKK